jgi:hypothetical protein
VKGGDSAEDEETGATSSRWPLSSDVWRTRCLPPPSAGAWEARRDQNEVARRVALANTEEGPEKVDSRAAFQRCRSATSHRLRFCTEWRSGVRAMSGGKGSPRPRVGFPHLRPWSVGMPLHSFFDWRSGTPHPRRHFHSRMTRIDVVGNRSPLLFPLYVGSDLWWYRGDRARHHYARVLSSRDLLRQERAMSVVRWTWTWTWVYAQKARKGKSYLIVVAETIPSIHIHSSRFLSSHHGHSLPHTHFLILSPCISPFRNKLFKFRHTHLQSVPQRSDIRLPPVLVGL